MANDAEHAKVTRAMRYDVLRRDKYLGVYNPRMNVVYRYLVDKISEKAIEELDYSIICYPRK